MMSFRQFLESDGSMEEERRDILKTLGKIPASHRALVQGFSWKFQGGNTLRGDDEHVGYMDDMNREIAVAAPWSYSREFTILHEIGHRVFEAFVQPDQHLMKIWHEIMAKSKHKPPQPIEELFCMSYAAAYAKHPPTTYTRPEWIEFIKRLPK
jgi:hypothetical protein